MYCRKCGSKIENQAKFCPSCGEKVVLVKQRSDAQKFQSKAKERENSDAKKSKREKKLETLENPYIIPAIAMAIIAFTLAVFPWPASWKVGTSLWMRILILAISLLSAYHSTKAKQVNRLYDIQYRYKVKPKVVSTAWILSAITLVISIFSICMM